MSKQIAVDALAHSRLDHVAVAVRDLKSHQVALVGFLDSDLKARVELISDIPLGHKFALKDLASGSDVLEYGQCIGTAIRNIKMGEHVHVHNIRSKRW